jgi:hypothetical protein
VYFVPGHPVLRTAMPELMKGLGVSTAGNIAMKWQQFQRRAMHNLKYGTKVRRVQAVAKPLLLAGLGAAMTYAAVRLLASKTTDKS